MKMKGRIEKLLELMNSDVIEKEEVIALSFLSIVASESIFLFGKPGVAKSLVARRIKQAFKSAKSFDYLMNRFSTPDEIFGPISIKKLKEDDKLYRNTTNFLPDCEIVFLDEIWKAGSSIQNSLLTIINERVYRNGDKEEKAKLLGLIAASNELPEENQGLEALWDRFIIRYLVNPITTEENFHKLLTNNVIETIKVPVKLLITIAELHKWRNSIVKIVIPEEVFNVIKFIRYSLDEFNSNVSEDSEKIYVSDRRWRKIIRVLKSSAFLNDRKAVDLMDCYLIGHCLWNKSDQIEDVFEIVCNALKENGYSLNVPTNQFEEEIKEFKKEVKRETKVKKAIVTTEFVTSDDKLVIEGLTSGYNLIERADYDGLTTAQSNINLYNTDGNTTNTYAKLVDSELQIHESSSWKNVSLKTQEVTQEKLVSHKPNKRLLTAWNKEVKRIQEECDNCISQIEKYRKGNLSAIQSNIFVHKDNSILVEENLTNTIQEFQKLKLKIEKVKSDYEQLN